MTRAQFLHRALHQLLGVGELLEDERDVHLRLAGKPLAPAIDAVLSYEREGVGEQIQRDGEPPTRGTHHRLVAFERVAMPIVNRHKTLSVQRSVLRRSATRQLWLNASLLGFRWPEFDAARQA